MKKQEKKKLRKLIIGLIAIAIFAIIEYFNPNVENEINNFLQTGTKATETEISFDLNSIPAYSGSPYVYINNNIPNFTEEDFTTEAFEEYSQLDSLGRCGVAYANVCKEIMPSNEEEREDISAIRPTGWKQKKYNEEYLYNRCHLIGWQLTGENANKQNLITGTRYFNTEGMLPFENLVDDYFENYANKNNHVLYRVTPIFEGTNLVASGVQMEAWSVEDNGEGVCFNVYIYNVQPGIEIDYATGNSNKE